jgi:hypothetical protein
MAFFEDKSPLVSTLQTDFLNPHESSDPTKNKGQHSPKSLGQFVATCLYKKVSYVKEFFLVQRGGMFVCQKVNNSFLSSALPLSLATKRI